VEAPHLAARQLQGTCGARVCVQCVRVCLCVFVCVCVHLCMRVRMGLCVSVKLRVRNFYRCCVAGVLCHYKQSYFKLCHFNYCI